MKGANAVAALALLAFACSSGGRSTRPADGGADAADAPTDARGESEAETPGQAACVAAGGQCVMRPEYCATVGPEAGPWSCDPSAVVGQPVEGAVCCASNNDAGCTEIQASNYDQSCTKDSDCIEVPVGNACYACFNCRMFAAINGGAFAQYRADVDKTPAGAFVPCSCVAMPPVGSSVSSLCCRSGQCHMGALCQSNDGSADGADAGAE